MGKFFASVFKAIAVLVTAYFILFVGVVLILVGLAAAFSPKPMLVEDNSVLVVDLGFRMTDRPPSEDPFQMLSDALNDTHVQSVSLRDTLDGILAASRDSRIKAIYLKGNLVADGYAGSFAALRELRQAIVAAAESKPVFAYMDADGLRDIYLKSAASAVWAHPQTMVDFRGLRSEGLYLAEAMQRLGIEFQNIAMKEFKSVNETFDRTDMSPEDREQRKAVLDAIWWQLLGDIAGSRGLAEKALDDAARNNLLLEGEDLLTYGFADMLLMPDEVVERLTDLSAWDDRIDSFRQMDFVAYINQQEADFMELVGQFAGADQVAILYLEGPVVFGYGGEDSIGDADVTEILREVREDARIKSLVVRINSPGGSSLAAERIAREIRATNEIKPVVVSMGGIAASAGYMAAASADYIFTEPSTITGSIGVASIFFNFEELSQRLSLYFDGVETHPFAGSFSPTRAMRPDEMRQRNAYIERAYRNFVQWVADGREMTYEQADELARGRVWIGTAAVEQGLADATGGLADSIRFAADKSGLGSEYDIIEFPRASSFEEQLQELFQTGAAHLQSRRSVDGHLQQFLNRTAAELKVLNQLNDPMDIYAIGPLIFPH